MKTGTYPSDPQPFFSKHVARNVPNPLWDPSMWLVGSPAPQLDDEVLGFVHVLHLLNWAGSQTGGFQSLFCPLNHVTMVSVSSLSLSVLDCEWDRLSDFEGPYLPAF